MKRIDKQAIEFLSSEGERFRRCSYDELASGIGGSPAVALGLWNDEGASVNELCNDALLAQW